MKYIPIVLLIFVVLAWVKKSAPPLYPSDDEVKKEVFNEGVLARRSNSKIESNPHRSSLLKAIWIEGWKTEDERKVKVKQSWLLIKKYFVKFD